MIAYRKEELYMHITCINSCILFVVILAYICFSMCLELNISMFKEKADLIASSSEEMLKKEQLHSVEGKSLKESICMYATCTYSCILFCCDFNKIFMII